MFVEAAVPKHGLGVLSQASIAAGADGLETTDDGCQGSGVLSVVRSQTDDSVEVIGHDHEDIEPSARANDRDAEPFLFEDLAGGCEVDLAWSIRLKRRRLRPATMVMA